MNHQEEDDDMAAAVLADMNHKNRSPATAKVEEEMEARREKTRAGQTLLSPAKSSSSRKQQDMDAPVGGDDNEDDKDREKDARTPKTQQQQQQQQLLKKHQDPITPRKKQDAKKAIASEKDKTVKQTIRGKKRSATEPPGSLPAKKIKPDSSKEDVNKMGSSHHNNKAGNVSPAVKTRKEKDENLPKVDSSKKNELKNVNKQLTNGKQNTSSSSSSSSRDKSPKITATKKTKKDKDCATVVAGSQGICSKKEDSGVGRDKKLVQVNMPALKKKKEDLQTSSSQSSQTSSSRSSFSLSVNLNVNVSKVENDRDDENDGNEDDDDNNEEEEVITKEDAAKRKDTEESMDKQQQQSAPSSRAAAGKRSRGQRKKKAPLNFPVEPRVIQIVKKPRTYMNHSYRDCSNVPPEDGEVVTDKIPDMSFPLKVHHMISQPEHEAYISWLPHGRAFSIKVPKKLEQEGILLKYFGHSRYSSFLRQLSNHGFKHISQGVDRNCYYHEFMLRGMPHLCKYMPEPKDARRLIPDPDNELDFYELSRKYPLPAAGKTYNNNNKDSKKVVSQDNKPKTSKEMGEKTGNKNSSALQEKTGNAKDASSISSSKREEVHGDDEDSPNRATKKRKAVRTSSSPEVSLPSSLTLPLAPQPSVETLPAFLPAAVAAASEGPLVAVPPTRPREQQHVRIPSQHLQPPTTQLDWVAAPPAAKRQAILPPGMESILGHAGLAELPSVGTNLPPSLQGLAELQQLIQDNNRLLAAATLKVTLDLSPLAAAATTGSPQPVGGVAAAAVAANAQAYHHQLRMNSSQPFQVQQQQQQHLQHQMLQQQHQARQQLILSRMVGGGNTLDLVDRPAATNASTASTAATLATLLRSTQPPSQHALGSLLGTSLQQQQQLTGNPNPLLRQLQHTRNHSSFM